MDNKRPLAYNSQTAGTQAKQQHTSGEAHIEEKLSLIRMTYGPDAIAKAKDGKTVFVQAGVVGDIADVCIVEEAKSFKKGKLSHIVEPSVHRVDSPCPYADICGGCPWSHSAYDFQLQLKRANVLDALIRIGHMDKDRANTLLDSCVSLGKPWGYRNKIELAYERQGSSVHIGMHDMDGRHIVRVDRCALLNTQQTKLTKSVIGALSYLSHSRELGIDRVGIRSSRRTKDLEIALWGEPGAFPRAQVAKILQEATHASSIVRVLTKGPKKARKVVGVERLFGKGYWTEKLYGEQLLLSAPSFFQVNTKGAEKLIELVLEGLDPQADDVAMDLYCGAGTFTLPLARHSAWVDAVEAYGPAVRDLRRNLDEAQIDNVDPVGGDAGREFPDSDADIIVVDPPRAGLAASVIEKLSKQRARRIAYVSCDPATLARDLARFKELSVYTPIRITPVDLFPQSFHVETVTILEHR